MVVEHGVEKQLLLVNAYTQKVGKSVLQAADTFRQLQ